MADLLFLLTLLLNLTGVFIFAAPVFSLGIAQISLILLAANVLYLVYRWPVVQRVLRATSARLWLVFLVLWPLTTVVYAITVDVRAIGLQLYYGSLFLATAVFVEVRGWSALRATVGVAILVSCVGLLLSWWNPDMFATVAELIKAPIDQAGRAGGFFIQPNVTAENAVFLFAAWFAAGRRSSWGAVGLGILLLVAIIAITGSRAGFVAALALAGLVAFDTLQRREWTVRRYTRGVVAAMGVGFMLTALAAVIVGIIAVGGSLADTDAESLIARLLSLVQGSPRQALVEDVSLGERLITWQQHIALILQRPWTGYGVGATSHFLDSGQVLIASHNAFIELAVNFGLPYVVFLGLLLGGLVRSAHRRGVERELCSALFVHMVVVVVLLSMTSNTIFSSRTLLPLLGGMLGLLTSHARRVERDQQASVPAMRRHEVGYAA